ncbi:MAG: hypothetical protein LBJ77_02815 [Holosporales bacterium]|nr:hypothetical protein [Holosporales bacterium]
MYLHTATINDPEFQIKRVDTTQTTRFISPPPKPPQSDLLLGDTEHRSGVYLGVHEHSRTGSTKEETDCGGCGYPTIVQLSGPKTIKINSRHPVSPQ